MIKPGDSNLSVNIEITAKKSRREQIKTFFKNKGFMTYDQIGKRDIIARPESSISLSHLLATIIKFRVEFRNKIFSTNTRVQLSDTNDGSMSPKELSATIKIFDFSYKELQSIFGDDMASALTNQFYTLNSLFQNPLCRSVYADMSKYPKYIKAAGEMLKEKGGPYLHFAQGAREALKIGAELRSYGTYETLEEVTGRFSEVRGGCQLSLISLGFFPNYILERIKPKWEGFIITGDPKFQNSNAVISVPDTALWDPTEWWALYHEIGHILIHDKPNWINEKSPEVQLFMSNKSNKYLMADLLVELLSEVVGFELGFFGDYDLYLKRLWEHLNRINPMQTHKISLSSYVIRTYFVELFIGHFRSYKGVPKVGKRQFTKLDMIFEGLMDHMINIENEMDNISFMDKEFIAADNAKLIMELYPFAKHISTQLKKVKNLRPNKKHLDSKNTNEIIKSLLQGKIWWQSIKCPEAVLYRIFKSDDIKFNTKIATILSFWNSHMSMIKERFDD